MKLRCIAIMTLGTWLATADSVFAQAAGGGGKTYSISWALILLSVILGLLVTLKSSGRKTEFKR